MNSKMVMIGVVVVLVGLGLAGGAYLLNSQNLSSNQETVSGDSSAFGQTNQNVLPTTPVEESDGGEETQGQVKEVIVEGSNYKFAPAEIRVKKGDTVRVIFKNTGGTHDFMIEELDVATNEIGDGEEEEVEFVAEQAGTFEYYCSVGNHRAMGMKGNLIVEE